MGLACDVADRANIRAMLYDVGYAFGVIDHVAVTPDIFVPPDTSGHIANDRWAANFAINFTGHYLI